jgi:hypothetical protein
MNKDEFIQRMTSDKKSQSTIKRNIDYTAYFEKYLRNSKNKKLENAKPKDLVDFKVWGEKSNLKNLRMHIRSISTYYKYLNMKQMVLKANELVGSMELDQYRLSAFQGINKEFVNKLKNNGIKTAGQLLNDGYTRKGRNALSKTTEIPKAYLLELVKLSDLARIPGVKKIRARLYYESGLDTLAKIAECNAEQLRKISSEYIKKSGFDGVPPTPKEAEHTVALAKYLKSHLEF